MFGWKYFVDRLGVMRNYRLPAVVFITGACVLIIELIATRMLSPFFGNTIYTVSSIVGVVLAALSIGYYVGGRLSDKLPSRRMFYAIITFGGVIVIILQAASLAILPFLGENLSLSSGPLVASLTLFLVPSILLGMLSPYAIKLQHLQTPETGIGTIAGNMFFWSTLGSITGSLSTGFVLIPHFGIDHIVLGTGLILLILGGIPLAFLSARRLRLALIGITVLAIAFSIQLPTMAQVLHKEQNVLYSRDGLYEKITIIDGKKDGEPVRFFQQDRSASGAMYKNSDELVYDYTKYYALYKVFKPEISSALVIGGGAYSIPKALIKDLPEVHVDVSEIEPSLLDLGKRYFNVPSTTRLQNHVEDGRRLLQKSGKKYDYIFSDVYYSLYSIPPHFTTKEFFQLANARLNNDGIFIANMLGDLSRKNPSFIMSEMRTFREAFPNSYFFATSSPGSNKVQNIIFVGQKSAIPLDFNQPAITKSSDPEIRNLAAARIDPFRFDLQQYPILTDDYTPVEYMTRRILLKSSRQTTSIDGEEAMSLIRKQLNFGPRFAGSKGHDLTAKFIELELKSIAGTTDTVTVQRWQQADTNKRDYSLQNIILSLDSTNRRRIIVGAHYDSKKRADKDSKEPASPVPGANDSGSGVALLLETARALKTNTKKLPVGIDFVFFDAEEGLPESGSETQEWYPMGSTYFAKNISTIYPRQMPEGGIVIDMVCDKNLGIVQDATSRQEAEKQVSEFWKIGSQLNKEAFLRPSSITILDDHTALNYIGIPSFVVIDFDFPQHHTTNDTIDTCSTDSLSTVGTTLLHYINKYK